MLVGPACEAGQAGRGCSEQSSWVPGRTHRPVCGALGAGWPTTTAHTGAEASQEKPRGARQAGREHLLLFASSSAAPVPRPPSSHASHLPSISLSLHLLGVPEKPQTQHEPHCGGQSWPRQPHIPQKQGGDAGHLLEAAGVSERSRKMRGRQGGRGLQLRCSTGVRQAPGLGELAWASGCPGLCGLGGAQAGGQEECGLSPSHMRSHAPACRSRTSVYPERPGRTCCVTTFALGETSS